METAKKRTRINAAAVCSSYNYHASKRLHRQYLEEHKNEWQAIIANIKPAQKLSPLEEAKLKLEVLHMRPYCKVLGRTKEIPSYRLEEYITIGVKIIWK